MMVLYSGLTCPFSHSCRFVLFEKGCEFEVHDIDMFQPMDVSSLNPYGEVPILQERDLVLYQADVINAYIDDRFPHPQLMPTDPMRCARARLFAYIAKCSHMCVRSKTVPIPKKYISRLETSCATS